MNKELNFPITRKAVLRFTLPSILMMVVMSLYTIVDGLFVARLVNTNAFSAINIVYPLLSLIVGLGTMFGTGAAAIVSKKLGEGNPDEARRILSFITLCSTGISLLVSLLSLLFLRNIIYLLGADEAVFAYCYEYLLPLVFFLPFSLLQVPFQSLFVANGRPHAGLVVTLLSGIANVVLDYFFIAVCGMGVSGAAIATGIGYSITALYGLYSFTRNRTAPLYFVKPKVDWRALCAAMSNGSSEMVSNLSTSVTTFLFNIIMMRLIGPNGVAAISILLYLDFVLISVSLGYSIGIAPLFSYNYGSLEVKKLRQLYRISAGTCLAVSLIMTFGTLLLAHPLAAVFSAPGSQVYELTVAGFRIYAFSFLFKEYNIFASAMFTAFGNGRVSAGLSFIRTLFLLVICTIVLAWLFGVTGVWWATPIAELLSFLLALYLTIKYSPVYGYLS